MDRRSDLGKHEIVMTDREVINLDGIKRVESFDEEKIILETSMGGLLLTGENLHITQLDLDNGHLSVEGLITTIDYSEDMKAKSRGLMKQLFR